MRSGERRGRRGGGRHGDPDGRRVQDAAVGGELGDLLGLDHLPGRHLRDADHPGPGREPDRHEPGHGRRLLDRHLRPLRRHRLDRLVDRLRNGWTGTDTTTSNGNFEYDDCVADFNGRTGITFFSAQGLKVKNCIVAHNGSSTAESWSSGVTLYEAQGGAGASTIEGNVSFENMDGQKHTDGSGFIIDEYSDGATFIDNIAFRNGGSCLRLTKSMNCKFINNTCYHDAQDTADTGPSNPSEVYFTKDSNNSTTTGTSFLNNVFVATGTGPGATAIYNQPTSGWANNQTATGSVSYFTSPDGTNPDFTLASSSALVGKGGTGSGVPATTSASIRSASPNRTRPRPA